ACLPGAGHALRACPHPPGLSAVVRPRTLTGALARAGFADTARAAALLAAPALRGLDDGAATRLIGALGAVADPDRALLALVRLAETEADLGTLLADGGALVGGGTSPADGRDRKSVV